MRIARQFVAIGIFALSFLGTGCSSTPSKSDTFGPPAPPPEVQGPPEAMGPSVPPPEPAYGPEPVRLRSVTLVLGPGMARCYAFAGAIRALNEAKIPIGAIVGTETGALIGALYALDGSVNRFEWRLMKFPNELSGRKMASALSKVFDHKELNDTKIPLRLAVENTHTGNVDLVDHGDLVATLAASSSSGTRLPFPVTQARALAAGPVVVLDVLSDTLSPNGGDDKEREVISAMGKMAGAGADELKGADLVIRPDMKGIGYLDYGKRTDAAFRGKTAIAEQLQALKQLVGMAGNGGAP